MNLYSGWSLLPLVAALGVLFALAATLPMWVAAVAGVLLVVVAAVGAAEIDVRVARRDREGTSVFAKWYVNEHRTPRP